MSFSLSVFAKSESETKLTNHQAEINGLRIKYIEVSKFFLPILADVGILVSKE